MTRQPARAPSAAAIGTVIALGRLEAVMYCTSNLRCGHPASQGLKAHISQRAAQPRSTHCGNERIGFRIDGSGILRCPLGQPGAYLMAERAGWPSTGTLGAVFYGGRTSPAKRHGRPT